MQPTWDPTNMNWLILAVVAGLASNGFNITNRTALKDKGDYAAYAWWFEFIRSGFFFFVVLSKPFPHLSFPNIITFSLVGLTELFSVYVFMKMHALTDLSISSIISRLRVVWSPLLAFLLVGERLTVTEYAGIVAIFAGISVVSSPKEIKRDSGIKTALLFSFSSALLSTVLKKVSGLASSEFVVMSQGIIPLLGLPFLMKNPAKQITLVAAKRLPHMLLAGMFNIVSSYLLVRALAVADASKVVGLYQAMTVFSVFYGIFILKEKEKIDKKIIGVVIVIIGILFTVF